MGVFGGLVIGGGVACFLFTEDGVVFESGQYVLQSYAVGIVDFEIPAADFGDDLTADIF